MQYYIAKNSQEDLDKKTLIFDSMLQEAKLILGINNNFHDQILLGFLDIVISRFEDLTLISNRKVFQITLEENYNSNIFFPLLPCRQILKVDRVLQKYKNIDMKYAENQKANLTESTYRYIIGSKGIEGIEILNNISGNEIMITYQAGYKKYQDLSTHKDRILSCVKDIYLNPQQPCYEVLENYVKDLRKYKINIGL